jgi:hypothetical protein
VSVQQAAAQVLAAVTRARSLFASSPEPLPAGTPLDAAAQSTVNAGQRAAGLSGVLADRHSEFVGEQAVHLTEAAGTDTTLAAQLDSAATLTRNGAQQLDAIVAQTRSLAQSAAGARSPADQRMVLAALQSRLSAANAVVASTRQQAAGIAGRIRSLDYRVRRRGTGSARDADFAEDGGPRPPQPGDPADEAARKYAQTQRAADQALVDQATNEGRTQYLPSMAGKPGYMTEEEAAAAARLRDYNTLSDPNSHIALAGGPDARKFAGERLDDFNTSKLVGPLPPDTVLGGDARTRAQTRLRLQQDLENGNLSWSQQVMTPDDATRVMDQAEVADRTNVLNRLQQQLVRCGMSPQAAAQVAEGYAHGVIPKEYVDAAAGAGKVFDGGDSAFGKYTELVPTGRHWAPGVAFSAEDIDALKRIGSRFGYAGSALALGTGIYEVLGEGKSPGEALSKAAGGWAGAWGGAEIGGELGAAFDGPVGAFIGAVGGSVLGAYGGDWLGEHGYQWLTK